MLLPQATSFIDTIMLHPSSDEGQVIYGRHTLKGKRLAFSGVTEMFPTPNAKLLNFKRYSLVSDSLFSRISRSPSMTLFLTTKALS